MDLQLPRHTYQPSVLRSLKFLIGDFSELGGLKGSSADYACVLTRGHMHDHESCVWASAQGMRYVGMMGCKGNGC